MFLKIFEKQTTTKKDPALDGLRGLAVLMVLFSHLSNSHIHIWHYLNFSGMGKMGVFLFFILSSYLLDKQIALALQEKKAGLRFWLNYFVRRFLRVFPLYILVLALNYIGHQQWKGIFTPMDLSELLDHILLQKGYYVYWSIPVEFKYYFLSPVVMLIFHYLCRWKPAFMVVWSLLMLGMGYWAMGVFDESADVSPLRYLNIFFAGTIIAAFESVGIINKPKKWFDITGLTALLLILLISPNLTGLAGILGLNTTFGLPWPEGYFSLLALIWALVFISVRQSRNWLRWLFSRSWLRFYGFISFSLYLIHLPVIYYFRRLDWPPLLTLAVVIISATLLATISYLMIEKPLMKIRLYKKLS